MSVPNYKTNWPAYVAYRRSVRMKRLLELEALRGSRRAAREFQRACGGRIFR